MALDPAPLDLVAAIRDQFVELLPVLHVLDRLLGRGAPALRLPAADPLGDAHANVLAVEIERYLARPLQPPEPFDDRLQLHPVVGGVEFPAEQLFFARPRLQPCAPAAGAGIALAGAIGVDLYFVQE